jgi:hypothetical protein
MDMKVWRHPLASDALKRNFMKRNRKPALFVSRLNQQIATPGYSSDEGASRMHPWTGLFEDPALHQALDRIMAINHIA